MKKPAMLHTSEVMLA